jgi:hypothetical protein
MRKEVIKCNTPVRVAVILKNVETFTGGVK